VTTPFIPTGAPSIVLAPGGLCDEDGVTGAVAITFEGDPGDDDDVKVVLPIGAVRNFADGLKAVADSGDTIRLVFDLGFDEMPAVELLRFGSDDVHRSR